MKLAELSLSKNPLYQKCPSCASVNTVFRSRPRNIIEKLIKRTSFFRTYRCKQCGWRGYLSTLTITKRFLRDLFIYLLIAGISGFIVLQILTRFIR